MSFRDALEALIAEHLAEVRVAIPARVESYDDDERKASVQPLIREGRADENGEREVVRLPVITAVPVVFPGSGGRVVKFPINKGDTVLLVFAHRSLDRGLVRGGEVDPADDRTHNLSDAIAIP